jgi:hypothetical protein
VLEKLTETPDWAWLDNGAHHLLDELAKKNPAIQDIVGGILTAETVGWGAGGIFYTCFIIGLYEKVG